MDSNDLILKYYFKPTWSCVKAIREKAEAVLLARDRDLAEATMMTASELIENAIKYGGDSSSEDAGIEFELTVHENLVRIRVTNSIISENDFKSVKTHIDKISSSSNPAELYTKRLMELIENPRIGVSQIGFYRIAYEGEFKLKYLFDNNILTIIAEREI